MLIPSHLVLSNHMYKYFSKELKIPLDKLGFMYGNIKPDLYHKSLNPAHYYNESIDFIIRSIQKLKEDDTMTAHSFSIELGVICHYLSDYFCLYHYSPPHRNRHISMHLAYELKLHNKLIQMTFARHIHVKEWVLSNCFNINPLECLKNLLENYSKENHALHTDIKYALIASLLICKEIILIPNVYSRLKPELQYA